MNKVFAMVLALIMLCVMPVTAFAEETNAGSGQNPETVQTASMQPEDQTSPNQQTGQQAQGVFYLDNQNVYDGMDKAYQSGYTPAVGNGTAVVVFPVLTTAGLKDNKLTVTPDLGDTGHLAFCFYQLSENRRSGNPAGKRRERRSQLLSGALRSGAFRGKDKRLLSRSSGGKGTARGRE